MSQERLMNVLLGPHVSEKSSVVADKHNQVVFKVVTDASKAEIRQAVKLMFEVDVESVQVANVKGKTKRTQRGAGRRKDWKKAYIRLKEGQDINFVGAE
ncbi:LSU ribosomal protein L23p (L23Ae) [hydrothermal vent metagenome]|uniref:LSU ribosomal protein L23p (L23Ae) n=1 Tax=hydrothermal vent metagenome TaxID=652676 RepID=A0A3B1B702_9ZZZZ